MRPSVALQIHCAANRHTSRECWTNSPGANLDARSAGRSPNHMDVVSNPEHMDVNKVALHGFWVPAQICLEQICIIPKGGRQDGLT